MDEAQLTDLSEALPGRTVATSLMVSPISISAVGWLRVTDSTAISFSPNCEHDTVAAKRRSGNKKSRILFIIRKIGYQIAVTTNLGLFFDSSTLSKKNGIFAGKADASWPNRIS